MCGVTPGVRFGENTQSLARGDWVIGATVRSEKLVLVGECDRGGA